ncbi:MAG: RNA polymerase sigma-70 factor [Bacteroidota bacterium]|nr:RNA polymerase sigma-70 factor [Bacteroidota bacterium]
MELTKLINLDDNVLAGLIKRGNQLAFATIYDRYHKQLYALAYRYLKSHEMAEDAVQQIFVNFWIKRESINETLNIKSFLFTSLKNHTLNTIRDHLKAIEKNYEILLETPVEESTDDELNDSLEMTSLIEQAVNTLSPQRKLIFNLKIQEGLSNQEVAQRLNISINTVKFQYSHILKEIRDFVSSSNIASAILISFLFR